MIICPACQHANPPNQLECEECGKPLPHNGEQERTVVFKEIPVEIKRQTEWRSAEIGEGHAVTFQIGHESLRAAIPPGKEVVLGRGGDDEDGPEVDLGPFHGKEAGVSRHHAVLRYESELMEIKDLGSTNGTYLNGRKLAPNNWTIVRNQDEIGLGTLVIVILFG